MCLGALAMGLTMGFMMGAFGPTVQFRPLEKLMTKT